MDTTKQNKTKLIGWITASFIIIALVILGISNKLYLRLSYSNLKHNHFNINDSMFVSTSAIKKGKFTGIPLYRLAKNNDKTFPYLVFAGIHIETDSLLITNRRYIGKYLGHEICHIEYKNVSGLDNLYIIQVDSEVVKRDNNFKNDVSNGFLYVNNNYYIAPYDVSNKVD